jgi:hypothetical protein
MCSNATKIANIVLCNFSIQLFRGKVGSGEEMKATTGASACLFIDM